MLICDIVNYITCELHEEISAIGSAVLHWLYPPPPPAIPPPPPSPTIMIASKVMEQVLSKVSLQFMRIYSKYKLMNL